MPQLACSFCRLRCVVMSHVIYAQLSLPLHVCVQAKWQTLVVVCGLLTLLNAPAASASEASS